MKLSILAAVFVVIGVTVPCAADEVGAKKVGTRHGVCSDDIQKFCDNVEHGKGKIRHCLAEHGADLSLACKTRIERHAKTTK